jgi:adenylylsulfate kinase
VHAVKAHLDALGVPVAVLESDALRPILTPHPQYDEAERGEFYRQVAAIGTLLTRQGVPVIFDATANRRAYRSRAKEQIPRFLEVYVRCPVEICKARDPKGIYHQAAGQHNTVPGLDTVYEPPEQPDLLVEAGSESTEQAAQRLLELLVEKGFLHAARR